MFNNKKNINKNLLRAPTHHYYYKGLATFFYLLAFLCFMFSSIIFIRLVKLIPY